MRNNELDKLQQIRDNCLKCSGSGYISVRKEKKVVFEDCECIVKIAKEIGFIEANIPPKYRNWDFRKLTNKFKQDNQKQYQYFKKYIEEIDENIKNGRGFWVASNPGLAKSSIITYILKEAIKKDHSAYFTRASHIITKKFEALGNQETRDFLDDIITTVDIIAIEEIEKIRLLSDKDMYNHLFYELISDLYDSNAAILISSNVLQKDVLKMFPTFISDRLSTLDCIILKGSYSGRRTIDA